VPDCDTWQATMSEQNKALVRKIYQATETGDAAILDAVVTGDVIEHPLNPGQPPGREALKQIFGGFSVLVPDLRITVEDTIAAGDRVAVRSTVTGTPTGPYLGVDPAGRPMRFEAIEVSSRRARHRMSFPALGTREQIWPASMSGRGRRGPGRARADHVWVQLCGVRTAAGRRPTAPARDHNRSPWGHRNRPHRLVSAVLGGLHR
jgi:predicted ester cyclase